jgi:hypothetical protein
MTQSGHLAMRAVVRSTSHNRTLMIRPIAKELLHYLASFDLTAIVLTRDGRMISTRDTGGCETAWWLRP